MIFAPQDGAQTFKKSEKQILKKCKKVLDKTHSNMIHLLSCC